MADTEAERDAPTVAAEPLRPMGAASWRDLLDGILAGDRRRLAGAGAVLLLLIGAGVAGYALLRTPSAPATELTLPFAGRSPAAVGTTTTSTDVATELLVHAAGAVAAPGVHRVPAGSRVADLLGVAGGPSADADLDRVNLAAPLTDGERVWFPRVGEEVPPTVAGNGAPAAADGTEAAATVNLNTATAEELDTLPGVGPATAAAILEHRDRHGPFASVDELLDVPGIGDAKLAQLRDLVTV